MEKKKIFRYIVAVQVVLTALLAGCTNLVSTYEEYRGDGEIIYVGKVDDVLIREGLNRVMMELDLHYARTAASLVVTWEGGSKTVDLTGVSRDHKFSLLLEDLEEGQYEFTFTTYDEKGSRSLIETHSGYAFGERYIEAQTKRILQSFTLMSNNNMELIWSDADDYCEVTISYNDSNGNRIEQMVLPSVSRVVIKDYEVGSVLSVSNIAKPSENAYDHVDLGVDYYNFPEFLTVDRSGFTDMALPSDAGQDYAGVVANAWDGNTETFTHTADGFGAPSHFTIDMGLSAKLGLGKLYVRSGFIWAPNRFQLWGLPDIGDDDINDYEPSVTDNLANQDEWETQSLAKGWINLTDYGATNYAVRVAHSQSVEFDLDYSTAVRYIRFRPLNVYVYETDAAPTNGTGAYVSISELYFYSK